MKALHLENQRFDRLTVIERAYTQKHKVMWKCLCDCGNITYVSTSNLTCNLVHSCGCYKVEQLIKRSTTHNQRHTNLYEVWKRMRQRCSNPKDISYKNYGGRGITVCVEWQEFEPFYEWSITNGYQEGLTIDRIDVNGNYEPSNCRWVDRQIQANNTRVNRLIEYNGKIDTLANWARNLGLSYSCLQNRLKRGLSIEKALTLPIRRKPKI